MTGLGPIGALLPLVMLASLIITALRRRAAKKKRYEGKNGRT